MLLLFRHNSNQKQNKQDAQQDKVAESIAKRCIAVQERASKVLQDRFEMLSITAKRFVVIAFCLLSVSASVFLILESFRKHTRSPFSFTAISVSKKVNADLLSSQVSKGINKRELEKIIKFRAYLDSLSKSASGKIRLDSIIINRRGLVDSLTTVENIYQLQSPNK